jgi:Fe-S-cluster containining protein
MTMRKAPPSALDEPRIEAIWLHAAAALGWRVVRSAEAFAASDGAGTLSIGVREILDGDDAVAQLVFHELCHALVEGPAGQRLPDWGLENADGRDVVHEHACLRLQVHLCERFGLRELMAPTTEYRGYHGALAGDPLAPPDDPAAALVRAALARPDAAPFVAVLEEALHATCALLAERHPAGFPLAAPGETCGSCAWRYLGGRGPGVERCRQAAPPDGDGPRIAADLPACVRWEPRLDCQSCGACCREAYHSVTVAVRDPVVWKQPDLIVRHGHRFEIRREGERCAALEDRRAAAPARAAGAGAVAALPLFSCTIYDDRPRACRDFAAGGRHCLTARRRVGLSL